LRRAVVISALGTVGACGCGRAGLARSLAGAVQPPATPLDRTAGGHRAQGARGALLTPPAALAPWVPPIEARRMSPPSRLAVAAARMAIAELGREAGEIAGPGTAVVMATAFGPSLFSEILLRQVLVDGPEAASPYLFTESVANAAAAQIAIALGARGANITLCQREAGALMAVAHGAAEVAAGRAERVLVGAVDEIAPLTHGVLDLFGTLARGGPAVAAPAAGGEVGRPFDRRRNGVVAADGATVLVLEPEEEAERRGWPPLARLLGWGGAFDPSAPPAGWGGGHELLGRAIRRTLGRCAATGAGVDAVDRIVSGASGSRGGDRLEARALRAAWGGAPLPPILAPKGVTGEYGGGFLAAVALAAAGAADEPTAGFREPDPELGVIPHDGAPLAPPSVLLASSLAAGGAAAWLILGKP
jgi:3-oxoacyl-[acyl-carrier-protein] synthase II